jgi:acyl carrier protein
MEPDDTGSLTAEEVEARLREFIERELLSSTVRLEAETDLLSGDLIDSLGALRLATFVGDEFGLVMQPRDLVVENFRNLEVLTAFVHRMTAEAASRE